MAHKSHSTKRLIRHDTAHRHKLKKIQKANLTHLANELLKKA